MDTFMTKSPSPSPFLGAVPSSSLNVLIVEDKLDNQKVLTSFLRLIDSNIKMTIANNGKEAVDLIRMSSNKRRRYSSSSVHDQRSPDKPKSISVFEDERIGAGIFWVCMMLTMIRRRMRFPLRCRCH